MLITFAPTKTAVTTVTCSPRDKFISDKQKEAISFEKKGKLSYVMHIISPIYANSELSERIKAISKFVRKVISVLYQLPQLPCYIIIITIIIIITVVTVVIIIIIIIFI